MKFDLVPEEVLTWGRSASGPVGSIRALYALRLYSHDTRAVVRRPPRNVIPRGWPTQLPVSENHTPANASAGWDSPEPDRRRPPHVQDLPLATRSTSFGCLRQFRNP